MAVHHAASLASSSVIHGMLNQAGNSARQLLSTPDLKGQLPIHHAALHGRIDIIHLIVQLCGREMLMSQDQDGNIPFHKGKRLIYLATSVIGVASLLKSAAHRMMMVWWYDSGVPWLYSLYKATAQ